MAYQQGPGYDPRYGEPSYGGQIEPYGQPVAYPPAYYPAPPYPGPAYGYPYPPSRPTNTMAILSLVFSLCGLIFWLICPLLGLVFGIVAKKQLKESDEGGDGLATAGVVVGAILVGLAVIPLLIMLIVWIVFGIAVAGAGAS